MPEHEKKEQSVVTMDDIMEACIYLEQAYVPAKGRMVYDPDTNSIIEVFPKEGAHE